MCERRLLQRTKSPTFSATKNNSLAGNAWDGSFIEGDQTMALLTAYLAYTARREASRKTASAARGLFGRAKALLRTSGEAFAEAQELRRVMARQQPFVDS
jgi:hypothetical protein